MRGCRIFTLHDDIIFVVLMTSKLTLFLTSPKQTKACAESPKVCVCGECHDAVIQVESKKRVVFSCL